MRQSGDLAITVVCDGVGGRPDGGRCARIVADMAVDYLSVFRRHRRDSAVYLHGLAGAVAAGLDLANERGELAFGAATSMAAIVIDRQACWAITLGDCRVIQVRGGRAIEATVPHNASYDGVMLDSAAPGASDAAQVTRQLSAGAPGLAPIAAVCVWTVHPGDAVVLTTDGVHEVLPPSEIAVVIARALDNDDLHGASRAIIRAMEDAGANGDNATAVTVLIGRKPKAAR